VSDSGEGDEWFESRSRTRKVEKKITALGSEIHTSTNSVCLPDVGPVERSMRHRDEKIKEKMNSLLYLGLASTIVQILGARQTLTL